MLARSKISHLSTVIGILMLVPMVGHAAWSLPDDIKIAQFENATSRTSPSPVEVRKAAEQFPPDSPLRFLLLGRSASIEGAHARAIRFLETAVRIMESDKQGGDDKSARWHAYGLYWLARCLLDAGKDREQIEVLAKYRSSDYASLEETNQINVPAAYFEVLALLKKGDVELAKKVLTQASKASGKAAPISRRYSALLDLEIKEAEGMDVAELLKINASSVEAQLAKGEEVDSDLLSPLGYYALRNGDFRAARQAFEECSEHINAQTTYHPYRSLAEMELAAGHWQDANRMMEKCWKWQKTKRAGIRQELEKETLLTVANGYLARGYPEDAWRVVRPLLEDGVRGGFRSSRPEKIEAGICLTAIAALRMKTASLIEKTTNLAMRELLEARLRSCIARHLAGNQRKMSYEDLVDCPEWLWGEVLRCLGPGVAERLISDYPPTGRLAAAKLAANRLEIARLRGEWSRVLEMAPKALDGLPPDCALLRARILSARAEALWSLGQHKESLESWEVAMSEAPAMVPVLGARLPIRFDGNTLGGYFLSDSAGFSLRTGTNQKQPILVLENRAGGVMRQAIVRPEDQGSLDGLFRAETPMTLDLMNRLENLPN
jgi:tetratricopeptide (TPR) repeat protein